MIGRGGTSSRQESSVSAKSLSDVVPLASESFIWSRSAKWGSRVSGGLRGHLPDDLQELEGGRSIRALDFCVAKLRKGGGGFENLCKEKVH